MPGKALSKLKKQSRRHRSWDKKLENVVSLWKETIQRWEREVATHQDKNIPRPSMRKFAKTHDINRTTLINHIDDTNVKKIRSSEIQQKLSPEEEQTLINAVISHGRRGFPLTHDRVKRIAKSIIRHQTGSDEELGKNWVERFLARHEDQLHTYWTKHLPGNRASAVNPASIRSWEDIVEEEVVVPGIRLEDMYGMDETHMPPEFAQMRRVIAGRGKNVQYEQGGNSRQTITVLVTICADGGVLQPNVIFKAARHSPDWHTNNVANAT